jgi:hypothetical protein
MEIGSLQLIHDTCESVWSILGRTAGSEVHAPERHATKGETIYSLPELRNKCIRALGSTTVSKK